MKVRKESSKMVKPAYEGKHPSLTQRVPLRVFDTVTYNTHMAVIFAYRPPTPMNSSIEQGLRKVLSEYRELAGRLGTDEEGNSFIQLNDEGVKFVEASVESRLDQTLPSKPSPALLSLHPSLKGVKELLQIQLTRFTCGSLVVGFTSHHFVADGHATSNFLVAWGQACRGLDINSRPFHDRTIFSPRDPPQFEFEHKGVEYKEKSIPFSDSDDDINDIDDIVVHKAHFTLDFLAKLKVEASSNPNGAYSCSMKPCTTFESLSAHLWRVITRARGLNEMLMTHIRISVDGRSRMKNPPVPNEYFGNMVLWAFPTARVEDLLQEPLYYAAKTIHDEIAKLNESYFKSFIDYSSQKVLALNLMPTTVWTEKPSPDLYPHVDVNSWLRCPFLEFDFGGGRPYIFMPSHIPELSTVFLVPSLIGDGSIDAYISTCKHNLEDLKNSCLSL